MLFSFCLFVVVFSTVLSTDHGSLDYFPFVAVIGFFVYIFRLIIDPPNCEPKTEQESVCYQFFFT